MRRDTLSVSHFESVYARSEDPWHFATSAYEKAKYAATLAALPKARYARALEVGCSIGVFTAMLADRCDEVLAVEPVASALDAARRRNSGRTNVRFEPLFVPRDWPAESFDLIVLSEVLDYLGEADLLRLADRLLATVLPDGDVVMVHWLGKKTSAAPDESSDVLAAALGGRMAATLRQRNPDYRLDVLTRIKD